MSVKPKGMFLHLIDRLRAYHSISGKAVKLIATQVRKQSYQKGEYFLAAPQKSKELGFILNGVFRYYVIDDEGNKITGLFLQKNDFIVELKSFLEEGPSEGSFQAETDAELFIFDHAVHQKLRLLVSGWDDALKRIFQEKLIEELKFTRGIVNNDAASSYRSFVEKYPEMASSVSDKHLASYLGITKFSLSRIKKVE